jgi:hypothetical protein
MLALVLQLWVNELHRDNFHRLCVLKDLKTNGYNTNSLLGRFKEVLDKVNVVWSKKFIK